MSDFDRPAGPSDDRLAAGRYAERLRRIRAAAESDADLAKLPALRDFLLTETADAVGAYPFLERDGPDV